MLRGSQLPLHGLPSAGGGMGLHFRRVTATVLNKQSQIANKGQSSSFGVGWGTNNSTPWESASY